MRQADRQAVRHPASPHNPRVFLSQLFTRHRFPGIQACNVSLRRKVNIDPNFDAKLKTLALAPVFSAWTRSKRQPTTVIQSWVRLPLTVFRRFSRFGAIFLRRKVTGEPGRILTEGSQRPHLLCLIDAEEENRRINASCSPVLTLILHAENFTLADYSSVISLSVDLIGYF